MKISESDSMDLSGAPESIVQAMSTLLESGFAYSRVRYSDQGNQQGTLTKQLGVVVLITADRSQWSIEVGGMDAQFDGDVWRTYLDGHAIDETPRSLKEQSEYLVDSIERIESTLHSPQAIEGLKAARRERALSIFGPSLLQ